MMQSNHIDDENLPAQKMIFTFEKLSGEDNRIMTPQIKLTYTVAELAQQTIERAALMELSNAISGASKPANWGTAADVCTWTGFYCTSGGLVNNILFPMASQTAATYGLTGLTGMRNTYILIY